MSAVKNAKAETQAASSASLEGFLLAKIPKTGELIARELRRRIVLGHLKEGEGLPPESELMSQLSVSRASLREALRILESESLITVRRGSRGGPIVHLPDPRTVAHHFGVLLQAEGTSLEDVFQARQLIEPPAVRIVVELARKQVPAKLQEIHDAAKAAVALRDGRLFGHHLALFHNALVELTGNKTLTLMMRMLNIIFIHHIDAIANAGTTENPMTAAKGGLQTQAKLLELIKQGDADGAVALWRKHLTHVRAHMFDKDCASSLIDMV